MNTVLTIQGMHCEKCAARLQKALASVPGIICAVVDKETNLATLQFDEVVVSLEQIVQVVDDCGFSVVNS